MKRNDIILGIMVLIGALGMLAFIQLNKTEGKQVEIRLDGAVYATKNLENDEVIELKQNEVTNKIIIEDGQVYMQEASCPDSLCVRQGSIHMTKEMIVCLPNKVTVKVVGKVDDKIDAVAQ